MIEKTRRQPTFKVTFNLTAAQARTVANKLKAAGIADIKPQIVKIERQPSRANRLSNAKGRMDDARSEVESIKEELTEWKENMPENLQDGEKGQALDDAIGALEDIEESLQSAIDACGSVEFPSMM